jgi:hypothetical protein
MVTRSFCCLVLVVLCLAACSSKEPPGSGQPGAAVDSKQAVKTVEPPAATAPDQPSVVPAPFQDEPKAHALYDQMINAMRAATSLSYVCRFGLKEGDKSLDGTYRAWLKKPNYFRVEAESVVRAKPGETRWSGILVGDGN